VRPPRLAQGQLSMREFDPPALPPSKEYLASVLRRSPNSRVDGIAFRHFLGRGVSSIEEFAATSPVGPSRGMPAWWISLDQQHGIPPRSSAKRPFYFPARPRRRGPGKCRLGLKPQTIPLPVAPFEGAPTIHHPSMPPIASAADQHVLWRAMTHSA